MVSFSGIDGAGKSTQIQALESYLNERGIRLGRCGGAAATSRIHQPQGI
jgi:thymidylate kinase